MPKYQCLIEGRNFKLRNENGDIERNGFFKTVFVESPNEHQAELDAIAIVRKSVIGNSVLNEKADPPMLHLDELFELEPQAVIENTRGFTFYLEKKWWEFWKK